MSRKILLKYLFIHLSFISGLVLYSSGIINIFSTLLLFGGGYISIKNTVDYRLITRNINKNGYSKIDINNDKEEKEEKDRVEEMVKIKPKNAEYIVGIKRTRRSTRVRRRY